MKKELDIATLRDDFPILSQQVNGHPLVYLDNAASTQVPEPVLAAVIAHYRNDHANVHRGIHTLSNCSTSALEDARAKLTGFIGAQHTDEIVFTSGATDGLNMLAQMLEPLLGPQSGVVATAMEHHANFVPWQQACLRCGAPFVVTPLDECGDLDLDQLEALLAAGSVRVLAVAHVSNVLGTVNPLDAIVQLAHAHDVLVVVDAAQSIRHEAFDVSALDCDFCCFSGHKMLAPTGTGVLYGKRELLNRCRPVRFGGEMVDKVRAASTTFEDAPLRFEAGTPNYAGAVGLGAAVDYLETLGRTAVHKRERALLAHAERRLEAIDGLHILGTPRERAGCLSFIVKGVHPYDIAALIDKLGVALRSGTQCAQPLLSETYAYERVTRLSPAFYNTDDEIDTAADALERVVPMLRSATRAARTSC